LDITTIQQVALVAFAYLLGSIPCGLVLTKSFSSVDIRQKGSGNIGATNVRRVAGPTLGALTLVGDLLKGAGPVYLACLMTKPDILSGEMFISLVAFLSFSGHLFPIYTKCKGGGKGVATAAGCFSIISPWAALVAFLVFIIFILFCNRVSAGSLAAAAVLPLAVWINTSSAVISFCAVLLAVFIFVRHKDNIKRLISGVEPVIWERKK